MEPIIGLLQIHPGLESATIGSLEYKILEVKGSINANSMELFDFGLQEGYIVISEGESNVILR
jgi:hypothetical protein